MRCLRSSAGRLHCASQRIEVWRPRHCGWMMGVVRAMLPGGTTRCLLSAIPPLVLEGRVPGYVALLEGIAITLGDEAGARTVAATIRLKK